MTTEEKQALNGRLYAHELILNVLLKAYIDKNADSGKDTEHLEAFVSDLQRSFEGQLSKMPAPAAIAAKTTIFGLLEASLQKYWKP